MSWFGDQVKQRKQFDEKNFESAFLDVASAILGNKLSEELKHQEIAKTAIQDILKYYHFSFSDTNKIPDNITTLDEQINYCLRPYGIMHREVKLDSKWYKRAFGPLIGKFKEGGRVVAFIPGKISGYYYTDPETGKKKLLNHKTEKLFDDEAILFYMPLPQKQLSIIDLLKFMVNILTTSDIVIYFIIMALATLLGMISPIITQVLFSDVVESKSISVLVGISIFMICYSITQLLFSLYQSFVNERIGTKQNIIVQAAIMSRMMSLPARFFKDYSSGELSQRSQYVQNLCSLLFNTIGITSITSVFSLAYIAQIFTFSKELVIPSLLITIITIIFSMITTFVQTNVSKKQMLNSTKESGVCYSMITGVQKIKLSGSEKRMFSRWARLYAKSTELLNNPPAIVKYSSVISLAISSLGNIVLYYVAINSHVSVANYYAFITSYGMVSSAFMSLASIASSVANIKPSLDMAKPIMEAIPEVTKNKEIVTSINGNIELNNVSFKYDDNEPLVIDDLSLKIKAGEYVAIVGSTGCGKSTLLRLLLGFETPTKGSLYYDNKDISRLDLASLRRNVGVVMQDGKLFTGDIYSNIVIAAPQLSLDEAWEAARIASLDEDIKNMPMGMNTLISEGQGGISGGQKQRLMIARAVAPKPKILMFDEATSALDNITQKKVSEAIDKLNCTRVVIAHRLSTIKHCDRIIVMNKGKIEEEGTYDDLINHNGFFSELVKRQRLDIED